MKCALIDETTVTADKSHNPTQTVQVALALQTIISEHGFPGLECRFNLNLSSSMKNSISSKRNLKIHVATKGW